MKLNIDTVKTVAEVAELIGEGATIAIQCHDYKTYDEALEDATMVSNVLGLDISEGKRNGTGWLSMKDKQYGNNIEIVLYYSYSYESKVVSHA